MSNLIKSAGDAKRKADAMRYVDEAIERFNKRYDIIGDVITPAELSNVAKTAVGICFGSEGYQRQVRRLQTVYPIQGK